MLNCPFCKTPFGVNQALALHMAKWHKKEWKGTIAKSIPAGIDIGFPDPKAVAARTAKVNATRTGNKLTTGSKWSRMSREMRNRVMERQRLRRRKERLGRTRQRPPAAKTWECPYCDFESIGYGAKTRHMKAFHPNETGLARMGDYALERAGKVAKRIEELDADAMVPETLEDRIIRAVAERLYQDMKGINK